MADEVGVEYGVRVEVHAVRAAEFAARKRRGEPFVQRALDEGSRRV